MVKEDEIPTSERSTSVRAEAIDSLTSFVFQTDDIGGSNDLKDHLGKLETPGGAWSESQGSKPSIANVVSTEVATFYDVFGLLGVPMLIVFLLSAAWTFMLAVIQVRSNEMANMIMNTTEFDGGNFWLLPQPDTGLVVSSVVLLSLFGVGYTGLAVMMIFFYKIGHGTDVHDHSSRKLVVCDKTPAKTEERNVTTLRRFATWFRSIPLDVRQHYYVRIQVL
ncbi:hypothetical protein P3T76_005500 [Phytophthora citrophthora]|uniref:Uncharacterized protein n=1 Tax=Phytophthora citrophthora TaxID=4793 RepID=A0AAD9LMN7_9STRA|nr:hypothetical protein P3T76_005500 [Phytophthora citrophthora]